MAQSQTSAQIGIRRSEPASLYVNYFEVAHNAYEFLIELGQFRPSGSPGSGDLSIHTRLAISPPYAKMLSELLTQAVGEHEGEHGKIAAVGDPTPAFDIVLRSLPEEYETRARELRERNAARAANSGTDQTNPRGPRGAGPAPRRQSRNSKGR